MSKQLKASELLQKLKRIQMEYSDIEDSEFEYSEKEIEIRSDNSNSDISNKENESSESEPENILNVRNIRRTGVLSSSENETESVQASADKLAADNVKSRIELRAAEFQSTSKNSPCSRKWCQTGYYNNNKTIIICNLCKKYVFGKCTQKKLYVCKKCDE